MKLSLIIAIIFMFFMVSFIRLYGCKTASVINPVEITKAISCPIADDITCQKCHAWKKVIADWHNPETGRLGKLEIILPEDIDIDFNSGRTFIINSTSPGKDWICEHIFYRFSDGLFAVQTMYNHWSIASEPPMPPLALTNHVYQSLDNEEPMIAQYWIYQNGVPIPAKKSDFTLYILSLHGGVQT